MLQPQLSVALGQRRVEQQLQGEHEIALADLVLADDDDTFARLDVEIRKIGEIDNTDAGNTHEGSGW